MFTPSKHSDDYLISLGIPRDWVPAVRTIRSEDQLFTLALRLPEDVGERIVDLASGKMVTPPPVPVENTPRQEIPDHRRNFYVVQEASDLLDILNKPLEEWTRFLHPSQHKIVERAWNGPVKVTGSAGTGKTVVALHRARHLARQGRSVLVTSYVTTLVKNLDRSLRILCNDSERARITTGTVHSEALSLVRQVHTNCQPASTDTISELIEQYMALSGLDLPFSFFKEEWNSVVDPSAITTWAEYRDIPRRGRGTSLSIRDRKAVWIVFEEVLARLAERGTLSFPMICRRALELLNAGEVTSAYDAVVVDEVQDLKPTEIRFLARLAGDARDGLMLVGDAGQRIYPGGFSLRSLGIETRGRSTMLRINYRTTEQIRRAADQIINNSSDDLDGGIEDRTSTRSLLNGPCPILKGFSSSDDQAQYVAGEIGRLISNGREPQEIAIFARTGALMKPYREALDNSKIPSHSLSRDDDLGASTGVNIGTMHRAKGLEFKVVFVVEISSEHMPLALALDSISDTLDRDSERERERRLLYVSLTRARDEVHVTWTGTASPFLTSLPFPPTCMMSPSPTSKKRPSAPLIRSASRALRSPASGVSLASQHKERSRPRIPRFRTADNTRSHKFDIREVPAA